ncbi:MAG: hopanoid-associated sugar epimerase [Thermoanaerobaculia bacterium]
MTTLVTGGTGFIGAHIVRALLDRGEDVRCLVRPSSRLTNLEGLDVEIVRGDLCDRESIRRAVTGAETVYHCAADYRLYVRNSAEIYATNVEGTRNVLRESADAGARKIVYTSSVGALGRCRDGHPADESVPAGEAEMIGHYKRSKFRAERVAEQFAAGGSPVVITNPSTPVGELDVKPTPTGKIIVEFLRGRMPAYVDTGMNLIDVRDVAAGHLLAAARGRTGERYILGNRNLTLAEILAMLARLTGRPRPRVRLPHWIAMTAAIGNEAFCRITGGDPSIPLEGVRMARHRMYFDSSKAVSELGLPQTPVEEALGRAVRWFREHGYASG